MTEWEQNVEAQRKKYLKTIPDEEKPKEILPTNETNSKMKISMPFS